MDFRVRLDEIVPTKQAARSLPKELGRLERGEVDQLVLTTRNTPRAVMVTVERFDELTRSKAAAEDDRQLAAIVGARPTAHDNVEPLRRGLLSRRFRRTAGGRTGTAT